MSDPTIVCVTGMHRSGTSLTARILSLLGVYLGPEAHLVKPAADNPKGFWEHRPIVAINQNILSRLGGKCLDPPTFEPGWEQAAELEDLRQRARTVIQQDFAGIPLWGWKDPRSCLTLPFWQQLLPPLRYVICLRNPIDVARSVERRDGLSMEQGIKLWLIHVLSAMQHSAGQNRIFVPYEDMVDNWSYQLQLLSRFLGTPERAEQGRVREAVQSFVDPTLQHHRTSAVESRPALQSEPGATALQIAQQAYARLGQAAEHLQQSEMLEALQKALDTLEPEIRKQKREANARWIEQIRMTTEDIAGVIPPGETMILVNKAKWGNGGMIGGNRYLPFMERNGQYWGLPPDDNTAIRELERLRQAEASFIVFAWPALPWLECFPRLHHHLRTKYRIVLENERVVAFDLR